MLDRLVHGHLKPLHDFVRIVYPICDADRLVDAAFASAARASLPDAPDAVRAWLYGEARWLVHRRSGARWHARNASAVRASLGGLRSHTDDWHAWCEMSRVVTALASLPVADQELLNIDCVDGDLTVPQLAVVLRTGDDEAEQWRQRARSAFRAAYEDADPDAAPEEVHK